MTSKFVRGPCTGVFGNCHYFTSTPPHELFLTQNEKSNQSNVFLAFSVQKNKPWVFSDSKWKIESIQNFSRVFHSNRMMKSDQFWHFELNVACLQFWNQILLYIFRNPSSVFPAYSIQMRQWNQTNFDIVNWMWCDCNFGTRFYCTTFGINPLFSSCFPLK